MYEGLIWTAAIAGYIVAEIQMRHARNNPREVEEEEWNPASQSGRSRERMGVFNMFK